MAWSIPKFSKSEVDRAGSTLALNTETDSDLEIIDNWRTAHNFPLSTFRSKLNTRAQGIEAGAIVSQRIKRLSSIKAKLSRFKTRLSQVQDIGGCRAVMSSVAMVNTLAGIYRVDLSQQIVSEKDYIKIPKPDGYRGIHIVCKYTGKKKEYSDLKIEIQLRSANQHAWATAVETVGLFTRQALKSSQGVGSWRRFFACMGNAIAYKEDGNPVPNTPTYEDGLRVTLADYVEELDVLTKLSGYADALHRLPQLKERGDRYFILMIDPYSKELVVNGYKSYELETASLDYSQMERSIKGSEKNAVLVSVGKTSELQKAYPNYFLDTAAFIDLVEWAIR